MSINLILICKYLFDFLNIQCEPCLTNEICPPCQTNFMSNIIKYLFWVNISFIMLVLISSRKKAIKF